jgi:hypothetical protein
MKIPLLLGSATSSKRSESDRVEEAVIEEIRESDDKIIEIRPANESKGGGLSRALLFVGAAVGLSYWLRKSQKPTELLQSAKSEAVGRTEEAADRTETMSEQAAQTIQEGGETVAERVEEGSQEAGEHVEQVGEEAAEATERAGEEAAESADEDGQNN